jgi:hypothetical protein
MRLLDSTRGLAARRLLTEPRFAGRPRPQHKARGHEKGEAAASPWIGAGSIAPGPRDLQIRRRGGDVP